MDPVLLSWPLPFGNANGRPLQRTAQRVGLLRPMLARLRVAQLPPHVAKMLAVWRIRRSGWSRQIRSFSCTREHIGPTYCPIPGLLPLKPQRWGHAASPAAAVPLSSPFGLAGCIFLIKQGCHRFKDLSIPIGLATSPAMPATTSPESEAARRWPSGRSPLCKAIRRFETFRPPQWRIEGEDTIPVSLCCYLANFRTR